MVIEKQTLPTFFTSETLGLPPGPSWAPLPARRLPAVPPAHANPQVSMVPHLTAPRARGNGGFTIQVHVPESSCPTARSPTVCPPRAGPLRTCARARPPDPLSSPDTAPAPQSGRTAQNRSRSLEEQEKNRGDMPPSRPFTSESV
ncbi:hypothetical protein SKAU_G00256420 [Synaphobranchus kaupii]|uniref:Uncharacterized protein n=1 Tax=Synaphobranchus kaupii TaxID=118154 RepID=A0A9Q1ISF1_SYNKA|nr:hypothetical protein SKAU_G00256420 [Synaphobranchus kaupii]